MLEQVNAGCFEWKQATCEATCHEVSALAARGCRGE